MKCIVGSSTSPSSLVLGDHPSLTVTTDSTTLSDETQTVALSFTDFQLTLTTKWSNTVLTVNGEANVQQILDWHAGKVGATVDCILDPRNDLSKFSVEA